MTRDALEVMGWVVLLSGGATTIMKIVLLWRAWESRRETIGLPATAPEHIVAEDDVLEGVGRLVSVLLITLIGAIWVISLLLAPPTPATAAGIGPVATAVALSLVGMAILAVLQGVRKLVYRHRLDEVFFSLRQPCNETTFAGCPYITPERLAAVKSHAQALASELEQLRVREPKGD